MALETNLNEKRKEKGKRNLPVASGLEACPSRPARFSRDWAVKWRARFSLLLPRACVGWPRSHNGRVLSPLLR
jgi:hypothetical protein